MIATLEGKIAESTPVLLVLELAGIGYEVHVPLTTSEKMPDIGQPTKLYIHSVYREDSQALYGFATRTDRDFFRMIVEKVSGIGPKIALGILSRMSSETLRQAIIMSDVALLSKCPGIGKKTAERLVIELRDKLGPAVGQASDDSLPAGALPAGSPCQDAVAALMTLGYKPADADKAIRRSSEALGDGADTESLIKKALA